MRTIQTIIRNRHPLKQSQRLILLIAVALVGINRGPGPVAARNISTQPAVVLQTATVPMLTGTFKVLNNSLGDQFDPHVDCSSRLMPTSATAINNISRCDCLSG